jgi:hypothetical protein
VLLILHVCELFAKNEHDSLCPSVCLISRTAGLIIMTCGIGGGGGIKLVRRIHFSFRFTDKFVANTSLRYNSIYTASVWNIFSV